MRTLTWTSPRGVKKCITVGGQRHRPLSSAHTTSLDDLEHFLWLQRVRVASRLQRTMERIAERRSDGMDRQHALTETSLESRR